MRLVQIESASRALNDSLDRLQFDDIVRVDAQMRQATSMEWFIDWQKLTIEDLLTPDMSAAERRAVLIFASFNPNGFIREQAVRMLAHYIGTLPYIMLRQNDWASRVRRTASVSFERRMHNLSPGEILSTLPYAEKLKWCRRGAPRAYTEQFFYKLTSPECREDLLEGLRSKLVRTRRICIRALIEPPHPYPEPYPRPYPYIDLELAFAHINRETDPFLRSMIFERLRSLGQDMTAVSIAFLRDRYTANRIAGLRFLRLTGKSDSLPYAQKMLLDRNAAVREIAREIVSEYTESFDPVAFYKEHLDSGDRAAAILGIGETGSKAEGQEIVRYLSGFGTAVERAAMTALMRLDYANYSDYIVERFGNETESIVKLARKLTLQYGTTAYQRILEIFHTTLSECGKNNCAIVLFTASKWQRLIYMLEVLSCDMDPVRKLAEYAIRKWLYTYNRSFVAATLQQKEEIRRMINACGDILPEPLGRTVLFCLE